MAAKRGLPHQANNTDLMYFLTAECCGKYLNLSGSKLQKNRDCSKIQSFIICIYRQIILAI